MMKAVLGLTKAKEETWDTRVVVSAGQEKCTRQFVRSAKKNVKSHLNPEKTVRYIARIVTQSVKTKAVKSG